MNKKETLKQQILQLSREYYDEVHRNLKVFEPGKSFVNYGGRFFDAEELVNLIDSSLDFWLTAGPWMSLRWELSDTRSSQKEVLMLHL